MTPAGLSVRLANLAKLPRLNRVVQAVQMRPYTFLFSAALVGLGVPFLAKSSSEWDEAYVSTADRLLAGGELYLPGGNYTYPPFMAAFSVPFALAGPVLGRFLWFLVCAASTWVLIASAWGLSGGPKLEGGGARRREHWAFWIGLACGLRFLLNGWSHHQTDALIVAAIFAGGLALAYDRVWLSAAGFALAAAVKGPPLLLAPYLVYRGRLGASLAMVGLAVGLSLLPDLVHAPQAGGPWLRRWVDAYVVGLGNENYYPGMWASSPVWNQSLTGAMFRTFGPWRLSEGRLTPISEATLTPQQARRAMVGLQALVLCGLGWAAVQRRIRTRRKGGTEVRPTANPPSEIALELSIALLVMVLFSPMSSKPHFIVALLPGFCLARIAFSTKNRTAIGSLSAAVVLVNCGWSMWGDAVEFWTLSLGTTTWAALALLVGCAACYASGRHPPAQDSARLHHEDASLRFAA
jgi:hypothetical protein